MLSLLIVFFLISIVFSFLCSMWEAVLLSVTPAYSRIQEEQGTAIGRQLRLFKDNIDKPLAAILTLNTIAHTVGAIGVGNQAAAIWADASPIITVLVVPTVMTLAILVLSEIIPKTLGATHWQVLAPFTVRSLRLIGFKSFVETSDFIIAPGLTGVVGPNGCGKSNLVEALRWVMGENSYKNMRASGMDDVIFSGSGNRPARNAAEVGLHIDNSDRTAPAAFNDSDEIQVSRRIMREQGSQYRINGKEARAKDVQLLFADASTGARSPSMVGQGRIGELIQAKLVEWSTDGPDVCNLILTSGGTGLAPRDVTPEATAAVLTRETPGITELLLRESMKIEPLAALSRATSGVVGRTLIINLPGRPHAVRQNLNILMPVLSHALLGIEERIEEGVDRLSGTIEQLHTTLSPPGARAVPARSSNSARPGPVSQAGRLGPGCAAEATACIRCVFPRPTGAWM